MNKSTLQILLSIAIFYISLLTYSQVEVQEHYHTVYTTQIPKTLFFANESVPLSKIDIKERLDKELLINHYWQSKTILLIKRAKKYFPIIEPILKEHNVPDDFKYLAVAESGLENVTSPAGAKGYWQFLKNTGIEYGLEINKEVDERYHLEKSTKAACMYLNEAYNEFGNWTLAAAAYNRGKSGIKKAIEKQRTNNYYDLFLNNETYRYVFRIIAIKEILSNYEKYGFIIDETDFHQIPEHYELTTKNTIENIIDFSINLNINYKLLKQLNPWIISNTLSKPNYTIKIAKKNIQDSYKNDTIIHTCSAKDNLFEIARKYETSIEKLLTWNNILPSKKLKKNQKIIILK